ncbi:hypothetical protein EDB82DRAFT_549507 [Fusarium venenatum]|uniref:uncharacterized protein n=1 Tax=Fusarium venenatum TaxID=56646 RepID=UPI001D7BFFF7|nr:hypothetical protein EDB82DRAFT_549507 [Fusarium venenatum]
MPQFETTVNTNDDTTIIFPWSDVEDSPSSKTRAQLESTTPAQPNTGTEILPAQDAQDSAAAAPGPPGQLETRGRGRGGRLVAMGDPNTFTSPPTIKTTISLRSLLKGQCVINSS